MSEASRPIRVHREAQVDITTAFEWYEARGSGLGFGFLRALTIAVEAAHRSPERYPLIESGMRRVMLRGFPHYVIFSAEETETFLVGVFHHRQDPGSLRARTRR